MQYSPVIVPTKMNSKTKCYKKLIISDKIIKKNFKIFYSINKMSVEIATRIRAKEKKFTSLNLCIIIIDNNVLTY